MAMTDLREYRPILEQAIRAQEENQGNPNYLGWEWYEVQAYPATLMKLVVGGVIRVNYRSNRSTCYLLVDASKIKRELGIGTPVGRG